MFESKINKFKKIVYHNNLNFLFNILFYLKKKKLSSNIELNTFAGRGLGTTNLEY
jgi:hypothetical protein